MRPPAEKIGPVLTGIVLCASLVLLVGPSLMNDFVEYWAAARLNLSGQNPYDPALMFEVERSVGYPGDEVVPMFNPPPVLTLVMPFGALPFRTAAYVWLAMLGAALVWSCTILWDLAGGDPRQRWIVYLSSIWFVPTLTTLLTGQVSILLLLGLALFLRFERDGRMVAAGAASTLLLIKPHLVYLVGVALIFWWLRTRDLRFLLGVGLGSIAFLVPLVFNPSVYAEYFALNRIEQITHYSSSTLGAALRLATDDTDRFRLQFVPVVLGLAYVATRLRTYRSREWDWEREMPLLVVVSVATAVYGWVFDQVVLLVTAIPMFTWAIRAGGGRLVAIITFWCGTGAIAFALAIRDVNYFWYFWLPHAFLLALVLMGMSDRYRHTEGAPDRGARPPESKR
jgi:hypothetical protein